MAVNFLEYIKKTVPEGNNHDSIFKVWSLEFGVKLWVKKVVYIYRMM